MRGILGLFGGKKNQQKRTDQNQEQEISSLFQDFTNQAPINQQNFNQNFGNNLFNQVPPPSFNQMPQPQQQNQFQNFQPQPPFNLPQPQQNVPQIVPSSPKEENNLDTRLEEYVNTTVENIVGEKLSEIRDELTQIKVWKEKIDYLVNRLQEQIDKLDNKIQEMDNMATKKLEEYDKSMQETSTEIQALHRLIRTMIPAISESTKELKETIDELKSLRDYIKRP
ncbi:MAG: hypothetical protein ACP5GJ_02150 [Nanopusillaceae archaeon]|jgi:type I site-specific restriction endonuclease